MTEFVNETAFHLHIVYIPPEPDPVLSLPSQSKLFPVHNSFLGHSLALSAC